MEVKLPKKITICKVCRKQQYLYPSRRGIYCSILCRNIDWRGERNPHWNGGRRNNRGDGYIQVYCPEHPAAHQGAVYEHRLVMEKHLGRYLKKGEIVHHKNHDTSDNRLENLELLNSQSEHAKEHYEHRQKNKKGQFV